MTIMPREAAPPDSSGGAVNIRFRSIVKLHHCQRTVVLLRQALPLTTVQKMTTGLKVDAV